MALTQQAQTGKQYRAQYTSYPNLPGASACFYDGNMLQVQADWVKAVVLPLAVKLGAELE